MESKSISPEEGPHPLIAESIFDFRRDQSEIHVTISSAGIAAVDESESPGGLHEQVRERCVTMDDHVVFRARHGRQKTSEKLFRGHGQVPLVKLPRIDATAGNVYLSPREPGGNAFIERTRLKR